MTTILYDGKNLHADKRVLTSSYPSQFQSDGEKLFVNDDNTVGIAVCGSLPNKKTRLRLFEMVDYLFKLMYVEEFTQTMEIVKALPIEFHSLAQNTSMIAITRDACFVLNKKLYPQTGYVSSLGTGMYFIQGCWYVLHDVKKTFKLNSELDRFSSSEFDSILADSLNPYHTDSK